MSYNELNLKAKELAAAKTFLEFIKKREASSWGKLFNDRSSNSNIRKY